MGKTMQKWSQRVSGESTSTEENGYLKERVCRDGQYRVDIQYSSAWEMYT